MLQYAYVGRVKGDLSKILFSTHKVILPAFTYNSLSKVYYNNIKLYLYGFFL